MMGPTRRELMGALAGAAMPPVGAAVGVGVPTPLPAPHVCVWAPSPFWLPAAHGLDEPTPKPPSAMVPLQLCGVCGGLRVDPALAAKLAGQLDMVGDRVQQVRLAK